MLFEMDVAEIVVVSCLQNVRIVSVVKEEIMTFYMDFVLSISMIYWIYYDVFYGLMSDLIWTR